MKKNKILWLLIIFMLILNGCTPKEESSDSIKVEEPVAEDHLVVEEKPIEEGVVVPAEEEKEEQQPPKEDIPPEQEPAVESAPTEQESKPEIENTTILPADYQNMLGHGMDVDWSKTNKGRTLYNKKTAKDFAKAGVSHVRIRIADWATEELLQGLDKQIADCLENGIIPIIAYQADELKNNPSQKNIDKVVQWWSIVSNRYKEYSPVLSFDCIIEVTDALNKQPEMLNALYEQVVAEIRKTNPNRIVFISPRLRSDPNYLSELQIPSTHNGYLMAEWHFYAAGPSKTNERKLWTTGTDEEKQIIYSLIDKAVQWQNTTGIPTWVGAWMAGNYNDGNDYTVEEQAAFAKFVVQALDEANIPFAVNSDSKFYNRENNQWYGEMQPVFEAIYQK